MPNVLSKGYRNDMHDIFYKMENDILHLNNKNIDGSYVKMSDSGSSFNVNAEGVRSVVIDDVICPSSTKDWFNGFSNLETITGFEKIDTSNLMDVDGMLTGCSKLKRLDFKNFRTDKVKHLSLVFSGCMNLEAVNIQDDNLYNSYAPVLYERLVRRDMKRLIRDSALNRFEFSASYHRTMHSLEQSFDNLNNYIGNINIGECHMAAVRGVDFFCNTSVKQLSRMPDTDDRQLMFDNLQSLMKDMTHRVYDRVIHIDDQYHIFNEDQMNELASYTKYEVKTSDISHVYYKLDDKGVLHLNNQAVDESYKELPSTYPFDDKAVRSPFDVKPDSVTSVVIENKISPSFLTNWFSGFVNLSSVNGMEYLDTSSVEDMRGMCWNCKNLTELDITHMDTHKMSNTSWSFGGCLGLKTLDLSHFDADNVQYAKGMFTASGFETLDLSHFKTANVMDMSYLFADCKALHTLDISSFDTKQALIKKPFHGCDQLSKCKLPKQDMIAMEFFAFKSGYDITSSEDVLNVDDKIRSRPLPKGADDIIKEEEEAEYE